MIVVFKKSLSNVMKLFIIAQKFSNHLNSFLLLLIIAKILNLKNQTSKIYFTTLTNT